MTYYGQAPRPRFWYRDLYVDVLPCMNWPDGDRVTLGEFGRWYKRRRAKQGGRIGEPYDKTMPKLRKSQVRAWRQFRFEGNRDLRLQGLRGIRPARLRDSWEYDDRGAAVVYTTAVSCPSRFRPIRGRDPRVDPRVGDVIGTNMKRRHPTTYRVTAVGKNDAGVAWIEAHVECKSCDSEWPDGWNLESWRTVFLNATVVNTAVGSAP
jgi:hypothetical protein